MTVQYWVGDCFIDLSRNQIARKEHYQTVAPKALAVLTYLAENHGKVVSYDELLSQVWPNTVVTPNTLQRSIAQLRKVLDEDKKIRSYIKTHAKQGYSLECNVQWDTLNEIQAQKVEVETITQIEKEQIDTQNFSLGDANKSNISLNSETKPSASVFKLLVAITGIIILLAMSVFYFSPQQSTQMSFNKLRSLTATDDKEFGAIYTPDGDYIVFNRYIGALCTNNIWAKNLNTQQEIQLTKRLGSYSGITLSDDGKTLAFVETTDCRKPVSQKKCYNLMSLAFEKSLSSPQTPQLLVQCKNSRISAPKWLDNNHIALFQKNLNRWKLINYSISDNKSIDLYEIKNGNLIHFTYSNSDNLIAVISIHDDSKYYIDMVSPDGELLSSNVIEYPKEISKFRFIYPDFDPLSKQLVFSSGKQLFMLSYDGKINKINFPMDDSMGEVKFHPNGKKLLLIKARYDSDIASIPNQLSSLKDSSLENERKLEHSVIERSTLAEEQAVFQPNGDLVAFISERSGANQIWITGNNSLRQITQFPMDSYIQGLSWSADGKSLLVNINNELVQVSLDTSHKSFPIEYRVEKFFQWHSEQGNALLMMRIDGTSKLVEYNLISSEFKVVKDSSVKWALKSEDGRLIYTDNMNRFWQPGPAEYQLIPSLNGKNILDRFLIKGNIIYAINAENKLWSYNLDNGLLETMREMPDNIDYLTDISDTQLLLELRISAKKEVVELSSNE